MKKLLSYLLFLAAITLASSCQKELPDSVKNIDVNQGGQNQDPTPVDPTQQGDVPNENDNPMPTY